MLAVAITLLACMISSAGSYTETLYPSHTCPDGNNWYVVSSDADSVTVACYTPDDPE